jgi:hypothetical protein
VTQFSAVISELVARFGALAAATDALTVVYGRRLRLDRRPGRHPGQPCTLSAACAPADHPDLLALPARRFRPVDPERFQGLTALETRTMALGAERRVWG